MSALLYDHQDCKRSSPPNLDSSDLETDDLLLLSRKSPYHSDYEQIEDEEQALVVQLLRRHM